MFFHLAISRQVQVANREFLIVDSDPDDPDLRTTRRIEGRQMGEIYVRPYFIQSSHRSEPAKPNQFQPAIHNSNTGYRIFSLVVVCETIDPGRDAGVGADMFATAYARLTLAKDGPS